MIKIFNILSSSLYSSDIIVILSSFIWGILSIILSPCHLAGVPLVMAFIAGSKTSVSKSFKLALVFGIAILLTILITGFITTALGRIMGDMGFTSRVIINSIIAVIFLVVGLFFLNVIQFPTFIIDEAKFEKGKVLTAFILGLLFGTGLGPCTFAFMAPVAGIIFTYAIKRPLFSFFIALSFGIGHVALIVFAGTFTPAIKKFLKWDEDSKTTTIVKYILGIIFIFISLYFIYKIFKP